MALDPAPPSNHLLVLLSTELHGIEPPHHSCLLAHFDTCTPSPPFNQLLVCF